MSFWKKEFKRQEILTEIVREKLKDSKEQNEGLKQTLAQRESNESLKYLLSVERSENRHLKDDLKQLKRESKEVHKKLSKLQKYVEKINNL